MWHYRKPVYIKVGLNRDFMICSRLCQTCEMFSIEINIFLYFVFKSEVIASAAVCV